VAAAPSAHEIIVAADAVRNPGTGFRLIDTLVEYRNGQPVNRVILVVYSKADAASGQYRTLVRFLDPARDRDKTILKSGNILWFYDPAARASVRISPQQRLMGQASNGDVVTVNLHRDYAATIESEETINDADRQPRACWRLSLRATDDSVTYWRIEYWVEKDTFHPIRGRFFSESDRLLKIAYYRTYKEINGRLRPTETLIADGLDSSLVTRMTASGVEAREIPESWFTRNYLPHFRGE